MKFLSSFNFFFSYLSKIHHVLIHSFKIIFSIGNIKECKIHFFFFLFSSQTNLFEILRSIYQTSRRRVIQGVAKIAMTFEEDEKSLKVFKWPI